MIVIVVCFLAWIDGVQSHSRWVCPPPRNPDTGIKSGPCGSETDVFDTSVAPMVVAPGPLLLQWEESITHTGAPFRISLSQDGTDTGSPPCVLLDHIPHHDVPVAPNFDNETTYILYSFTIEIPDIQCDRCSLHLANPMTDKIGDLGAPTAEGCTDPNGTCFSVYHSCTLPLTIPGSTPRSQFTCPNVNPSDFPSTWIGDGGQSVDASVRGTYRRESATWSGDSFLLDAPSSYRVVPDTLLSCVNTRSFTAAVSTAKPVTAPTPPPTLAPVTVIPTLAPSTAAPTNATVNATLPPSTRLPTTTSPTLSPTLPPIPPAPTNMTVDDTPSPTRAPVTRPPAPRNTTAPTRVPLSTASPVVESAALRSGASSRLYKATTVFLGLGVLFQLLLC
jgi:hypothetical protein